jgi:hypothetical protein
MQPTAPTPADDKKFARLYETFGNKVRQTTHVGAAKSLHHYSRVPWAMSTRFRFAISPAPWGDGRDGKTGLRSPC